MKHPRPHKLARAVAVGALALGLLVTAAGALADASPKVLKKVPPEFPSDAVRHGIDKGVLKAHVTVDGGGLVTEVSIVDTQPPKAKVLNGTVIEALKEWKFEGSGKQSSFDLVVVLTAD